MYRCLTSFGAIPTLAMEMVFIDNVTVYLVSSDTHPTAESTQLFRFVCLYVPMMVGPADYLTSRHRKRHG